MFIKGHFNFLIKIARGKPVQIWARRYHFNEYGDFTENTKKWPEDISKKVLFRNEKQKIFNDDVIAVLNDFKDFADESGAKVYQLFPVIPKLHYHDSEVYIQYAYNRLAEESNIELLNKPEEFTLPLEYFFDEIYHVNNDGRQIYTGWVIERLKEVLEPPNTDMAITEK